MNIFKATLFILFISLFSLSTPMAQAKTIDAEEIKSDSTINRIQPETAAFAGIAILTIFADPTASTIGSSWLNYNLGTHAFITIKNISSSNIQIGNLSNIAPGRTISIGTWGNKSEHKGLWYNLEASYVSNNSAYSGRVSYSAGLSEASLKTINSYIQTHDSWSNTSNCSSFAVGAWNSVVASQDKLSAGTPKTPKKLADNIKAKWPTQYAVKYSVPYYYAVYYAQGTGAPKRSTVY